MLRWSAAAQACTAGAAVDLRGVLGQHVAQSVVAVLAEGLDAHGVGDGDRVAGRDRTHHAQVGAGSGRRHRRAGAGRLLDHRRRRRGRRSRSSVPSTTPAAVPVVGPGQGVGHHVARLHGVAVRRDGGLARHHVRQRCHDRVGVALVQRAARHRGGVGQLVVAEVRHGHRVGDGDGGAVCQVTAPRQLGAGEADRAVGGGRGAVPGRVVEDLGQVVDHRGRVGVGPVARAVVAHGQGVGHLVAGVRRGRRGLLLGQHQVPHRVGRGRRRTRRRLARLTGQRVGQDVVALVGERRHRDLVGHRAGRPGRDRARDRQACCRSGSRPGRRPR